MSTATSILSTTFAAPSSSSSSSISSSFSSSFPSVSSLPSLKQKLELVFSHPFVLPYLTCQTPTLAPLRTQTQTRTYESFRGRFLASICVGIEMLLEKYIFDINTLHGLKYYEERKIAKENKSENEKENEKENEVIEKARNDFLIMSLANLLNLLASIPLIISSFGR